MPTNDVTEKPVDISTGDKVRRPYRSPRLRALGSVREVTWSGSPVSSEGALRGVAPKKGM